jgi:hypothetical protein
VLEFGPDPQQPELLEADTTAPATSDASNGADQAA